MGLGPLALLALNHPGRNRHQRAHRAAAIHQLAIALRFTNEETHRRVEPQRFVEHCCGVGKLAQVIETQRALAVFGAQQLLHLSAQALLHLWITAHQVGGHAQGAGRGLMPGQKQKTNLINQLLLREAAAGFRVLGLNQGLQQILGRRRDAGRVAVVRAGASGFCPRQPHLDGRADPAANRAGVAAQVGLEPAFAEA